jgi:EAL domain-containing protein (putative c-di-GMP-specific phosphodiesterase class I)
MGIQHCRKYHAGEFVFHEGEPGDCAFIIENGDVQISVLSSGKEIIVSSLGPGDIFGEMSTIDNLNRSASAYTLSGCNLSVVPKDLLTDRIRSSDPIVRLVISLLMRRVRNMNHALRADGSAAPIYSEQTSVPLVNSEEARERLRLENDLIEALQRNEFYLDYQPILDLNTRGLVGFEALVRWNSPERGNVRPNEFIDVAEQTAVIIPMGEWILKQSFRDLKIFQTALQQPDLFMSVNVSIRQLNDPLFVERLDRVQQRENTNPKHIKLEVTERIFQEGPMIFESIDKVTDRGYQFSLDDFGTGYASLTSLFHMKVGNIKIDRTFVSTMVKDKKSKAIVRALLALAHELGLGVVAEGIEHEAEAKILSSMGCLLGQGYHFAKPLSIDKIIAQFSTAKKAA